MWQLNPDYIRQINQIVDQQASASFGQESVSMTDYSLDEQLLQFDRLDVTERSLLRLSLEEQITKQAKKISYADFTAKAFGGVSGLCMIAGAISYILDSPQTVTIVTSGVVCASSSVAALYNKLFNEEKAKVYSTMNDRLTGKSILKGYSLM